MVCKLEMRYLFGAGLLVKEKLPFHILKDMDSASVTMKSVAQILSDGFPDRIENTTEGLYHRSDTEINEVFKITIV
jgi:hypothetical protein